MSADNWTTTKALANPTTELVLVKDLRPGDLFFVPGDTSGPDPVRVRFVDRFPGGMVNVHATPGALLLRSAAQSVGVWDGAQQGVRRVVL